MQKSELNQNIRLSEGNIKSKCTDNTIFLTWSLPSRKTCPYATEMCKSKCFAKKNETFSNVRASRERNYEETKKEGFVNDMINHFDYHLSRKKTKGKKIFVRIHTSGDFYNLDYLKKWVEISNHFKNNKSILFQAYTKSMPILDNWIKEGNSVVEDMNIHIVWSVWNDTPKEFTQNALRYGLQTFTALPKEDIPKAVNSGAFSCNGDCGNCKECYTGESLQIVIPYH